MGYRGNAFRRKKQCLVVVTKKGIYWEENIGWGLEEIGRK